MDASTSPYLILFKEAAGSRLPLLSEGQRADLMEQWNGWFEALVGDGRAKAGARLGSEGRTLRSNGEGAVRDGPFVETKEEIIGYFCVVVASLEHAVSIAKECPGLTYGMTIDIRPAPGCLDFSVSIQA